MADDIQVDLAPQNLAIAITQTSLDVAISPTDVNVSVLPVPSCNVSVLQQNVAIDLSPINFDVTVFEAPDALDLATASFDVAISTGPCYEVDVVHPDLILSNTATAEGPQGPPGLTGATGADSTVPGPSGPPGATGPPGSSGPTGSAAWTTTLASFTVPAVGATNTVNVADASWIAVGEMVYLDTAGGPATAGALQVTAKTGTQLTLLTPTPPPASTGTSIQITWGETPTGAIDGSNKSYTSVNPYRLNSIAVFLNGLRQRRTNDYTETGSNSFQFVNAPLPGDILSIDYTQP
jgi:hypothetical protein